VVKTGLAFELKGILQNLINEKDKFFLQNFLLKARDIKNLQILGPKYENHRAGIISFSINHNGPKGTRFFH